MHPRPGGHHQVITKTGGNPHAHQPAAVADLPRRGIALLPAKVLSTGTQALHQLAAGEGTIRIGGVDLGIVQNAELHRIDACLLGDLVDSYLQHHHTRRFPWGAHRVPLGQIQLRQPQTSVAVRAGIEKVCLLHGGLWLAFRQVAGPALMGDGGNMPGFVGANPHLLDGGWAVSGIVRDQRSGEHHLYRALRCPSAQRGQQGIAAQKQLAAKAAADVGRQHADVLFRHIQR